MSSRSSRTLYVGNLPGDVCEGSGRFVLPERIQRHYIVIFSTVSVFGIFGIPCFIRTPY
ncbi:hypothetical protein E1A91_D05G445700v1 [Gossypium mustelinum]|uniref:Uncharacterized protein n=1 Tax=Gossypium mustelinum TaxID=34275 RepID=A0A5D2V874_GOSMU|nr:hypothetical protein E1A91_D05G445700v1 [Gossypium mustelinum]